MLAEQAEDDVERSAIDAERTRIEAEFRQAMQSIPGLRAEVKGTMSLTDIDVRNRDTIESAVAYNMSLIDSLAATFSKYEKASDFYSRISTRGMMFHPQNGRLVTPQEYAQAVEDIEQREEDLAREEAERPFWDLVWHRVDPESLKADWPEAVKDFRARGLGQMFRPASKGGIAIDEIADELERRNLMPPGGGADALIEKLKEMSPPRRRRKSLRVIKRVSLNQNFSADEAQARLDRDVEAWKKTVDEFTNGTLSKRQPVIMLNQTPLVLSLLGAKTDLKVSTTYNVLKKVLVDKHKLPVNAVKQVPAAMANPIMILASDTVAGDYVMVLDIKDEHGATVIVPIALEQQSGRGEYVVNVVTSMYSKKNASTNQPNNQWFINQIENGNLRYIDNKKSRLWLRASGLQLPRGLTTNGKTKVYTEADLVNLKNQNPTLYQFAGERGAAALDAAEEASVRMDNLSVAREMEKSGKDAQTIKLATGWERGADGEWRYEIPDGKIRKNVTLQGDYEKTITLGELYDAPELYKAYPELAQVNVFVHPMEEDTYGSSEEDGIHLNSKYMSVPDADVYARREAELMETPEYKKYMEEVQKVLSIEDPDEQIRIVTQLKEEWENTKIGSELEELSTKQIDSSLRIPSEENLPTLVHEIQHRIQDNEGFAKGGSPELFLFSSENGMDAYKKYTRLMGETEARNVSTRLDMDLEQRRARLASETEDVAREDQIFIKGALEAPSLQQDSLQNDEIESIEDNDKDGDIRLKDGSYINWRREENWDDSEYILITGLEVAPESRRKGLGRRLLRSALARIKSRFPDMEVRLDADPIGDEAVELENLVEFYESEGFDMDDGEGMQGVPMTWDGRLRNRGDEGRLFQDAYNGSQRRFNEFSTDVIGRGDEAQARLDRDVEAWKKTVDGIAAQGKAPSSPVLMLSQTPLVFQLLGTDTVTGKAVAEGGIYAAPHVFDGTHPNMTPEMWKQIPEAMTDPIVVFDSDSPAGRANGDLVFMLELQDANGATVVVPVALNARGKTGAHLNIVKSAYTKEQNGKPSSSWFVKQAQKNARYINGQKWTSWTSAQGSNSPLVAHNVHGSKVYTEADLVNLKNQNPTLYQDNRNRTGEGAQFHDNTAARQARGFVEIAKGHEYTIQLLQNANLSTLLHETGHIALSEMEHLMEMGLADDKLRADYQKIREYLGLKEGDNLSNLSDPRMVQANEKFAKAMELYLREGKAPSANLEGAFSRFKRWLMRIYKSVTDNPYFKGVTLNEDIRGVFDRLLANDAEIRRAAEKVGISARQIDKGRGMVEGQKSRLHSDGCCLFLKAPQGRSRPTAAGALSSHKRLIHDRA